MDIRLPEALSGHAGYLAVRFGHDAQQLFEARIGQLELRPSAYDFLSAVAEFGPISQRSAAAVLGIDASRIVGLVDELQRRGVVVRVMDSVDRRRNLISLTPDGVELLGRARSVADAVEAALLEPLTVAERAQLRSLLRRALRMS